MDIKYNSSINNPNLSIKSYIFFACIITLVFCLQVVFLNSLPFFYGTANLLLVVAIILSILEGEYIGFFVGLICGALLDIWLNTWFINSFLFSLLAVGFGYIGNHIAKKNVITVIFSVMFATFLFEGISALIFCRTEIQYAGLIFLNILIPHIIYNSVLSLPVYSICHFTLKLR